MGLLSFLLAVIFLLIFTIFSALMAVGVNFKFKDYYKDEDLIYKPELPKEMTLKELKEIKRDNNEKITKSKTKSVLIDMHCHSRVSDGLLTPKQLILWHISNGYDGLVITDHNSMDAVLELIEIANKEFPNFIIIPGMEFTSLRVHLNIIGGIDLIQPGNLDKFKQFKKKIILPNLLWTTKRTIRKFIRYAHEHGFLVQFNHKDWYPHKFYLPFDWYVKNGIDGWEIYNGFDFSDPEGMKRVLEFNSKPENNKKLFLSAGTDVHDPVKHLRAYTEILLPNDSNKENILYDIMESLKQGRTIVHFCREEEINRERPERGKRIKNKDRDIYIKKWLAILLPAYAFSSKKYRPYAIAIYFIIIFLAMIF